MTILLLTHSYPDAEIKWRGLFIKDQAIALSTKHEVIVVYFKVDYSHLAPFSKYSFIQRQNGKVTEYELTTGKSFPVINQLKYLMDTYRFIRKEIFRQKKVDIIHSHLSYPAGFLGTIIQKRQKIPNILTEHSWIEKYFRSRIHKICVLYTLKNSSGIVSVSSALKDDIIRYCNRQIFVVPNVIDVGKFSVSVSKKDNKLNIGILGAMDNYRKGVDILLEAAAILRDMEYTLHIGGQGKHLDTFKRMSVELGIASKCKFYGEIKPENITAFYSKLDIYVLPSREETFGVVVAEAMASGLPVIATRCGGPEEIVTKETGVLISKENPQELAQSIRNVSENLNGYDSAAIRNYVVEKYSIGRFIASITDIYQELLKNTK